MILPCSWLQIKNKFRWSDEGLKCEFLQEQLSNSQWLRPLVIGLSSCSFIEEVCSLNCTVVTGICDPKPITSMTDYQDQYHRVSNGGSHQGKLASEVAQICLDLSALPLDGLWYTRNSSKEKINLFIRKQKCFLLNLIFEVLFFRPKCCLIAPFFDHHYLWKQQINTSQS